jgi:hypothetical protein
VKKLLVFLVLLALGAVLLKLAIGDDPVVAKAPNPAEQRQTPATQRTPGLGVQQGKVGASVGQRGALLLPRYRTTRLPDGSERHDTAFVLKAKDSQPIREGLQELIGLEVTIFDDRREAALLTASRAFVEITADANGRPSLREDKELDLRDVVVVAQPGSRLAGLRAELPLARLRVADDAVYLSTPSPDDPVTVEFAGEYRGKLTGKGLRAKLPQNDSADATNTELTILGDVRATTDELQLTSQGPLRFTDQPLRGCAEVHAEDRVAATWTPAGGIRLPDGRTVADGTVHLLGERFSGWLMRGKFADERGRIRDSAAWDTVQVVGEPATLRGPDTSLTAPRLTAIAGWSGQPAMFAAHGGPARIELAEVAGRDARQAQWLRGPLVGTSPTRIELYSAAADLAALHRNLGFPLWTVRPLATAGLVAFGDRTRLQSANTQFDAADGLRAMHFGSTETGVLASGRGAIELQQAAVGSLRQPVHVRGTDGFVLRAGQLHEHLQLGPATPSDAHEFAITTGTTRLAGTGACELERDAAGTRVRLRSPGGRIAAEVPDQQLALTEITALDADLADDVLRRVAARGGPIAVRFVRDQETLEARADRIEQLPDGGWVLLPGELAANATLPTLRRLSRTATGEASADGTATARAPRIELHHLGEGAWLVDARGDADRPANITGEFVEADGRRTNLEVDAARLRLLPYLVARDAAWFRGSAGNAWLLGDDVSRLFVVHPEHGELHGSGHRLLLSQGAAAASLFGDPGQMTPARLERRRDGKVVALSGAQVRAYQDSEVRLQALRAFPGRSAILPPQVTLQQPRGANTFAALRANSDGDIDVRPEQVVFGGPVRAHSLRDDGSVDPLGLHVVAEQLQMQRHPKTGEILLVRGRDIHIDWAGVRGRSREAELDLRWQKCTARDPDDAEVVLPDGQRFVAPEIEIFYDRMEVRCHQGRFSRQVPDSSPSR